MRVAAIVRVKLGTRGGNPGTTELREVSIRAGGTRITWHQMTLQSGREDVCPRLASAGPLASSSERGLSPEPKRTHGLIGVVSDVTILYGYNVMLLNQGDPGPRNSTVS